MNGIRKDENYSIDKIIMRVNTKSDGRKWNKSSRFSLFVREDRYGDTRVALAYSMLSNKRRFPERSNFANYMPLRIHNIKKKAVKNLL